MRSKHALRGGLRCLWDGWACGETMDGEYARAESVEAAKALLRG